MRSSLLALAAGFLLAATAPEVAFRDVARKAGLTDTIVSGGPKKNYVLEVN